MRRRQAAEAPRAAAEAQKPAAPTTQKPRWGDDSDDDDDDVARSARSAERPCAVCHDEKRTVRLDCPGAHEFCAPCVDRWMAQTVMKAATATTCPERNSRAGDFSDAIAATPRPGGVESPMGAGSQRRRRSLGRGYSAETSSRGPGLR